MSDEGDRAELRPGQPPGSTTPAVGTTGLASSSVLVAVGLLITSLISAAQALLLVFIVGKGEATDAFLAAYSLYMPLALLGVSMRRSMVPLLGRVNDDARFHERASDLVSRVGVLGFVAAGVLVALTPAVAHLMFEEFSSDGRSIAVIALFLLAPAAYLQIQTGAMSGTLNAVRRFKVSVAFYVASGTLAVVCSGVLLTLIGVLGTGVGVLVGSSSLALAHVIYLRRLGVALSPHPRVLRDRGQARLGFYLLAGAALGGTQQLSLPIALSALSQDTVAVGTITSYVYAYFIVGLVLTASSIPLSLVILPNAIDSIARWGPDAARRQLLAVMPFVFAVMVPMLAALALFGEPLLQLVFGAVLPADEVREMYELLRVLELRAVPTSLYLLGGSLLLALGRWRSVMPIAGASLAVYAALAFLLAPFGPLAVALGQVCGALVAALILMSVLFRHNLANVLIGILRRSSPAFLFAATFVLARLATGARAGLLTDLVALLAATAAYLALTWMFWPTVATPIKRLVRGRTSTA